MNAAAYYNEIDPFAAQWLRNRVGRLKGCGNAINAQAAAEFIRAYMKVSSP